MRVVNARREIVGGEMFGRAREQFDDEPPRGRDPPTFGTQRVERPRCICSLTSASLSGLTRRHDQAHARRNCKVFASGRELWI